MIVRRLLVLTLAPLFLASCDGGGDPVQQAMREAAARNHAATVVPGTVSGPDGQGSAPAGSPAGGQTTGVQAFAAPEAEMQRRMAAATGETVDQAYIAKMIAHHQGAVAMAEIALRDSRDPEVRRMAEAVIADQTRAIAAMRAWRPAPAP